MRTSLCLRQHQSLLLDQQEACCNPAYRTDPWYNIFIHPWRVHEASPSTGYSRQRHAAHSWRLVIGALPQWGSGEVKGLHYRWISYVAGPDPESAEDGTALRPT